MTSIPQGGYSGINATIKIINYYIIGRALFKTLGFINRCDKKHKYDVGASPSLLKSFHVMPLRVFGQIYSLIFIEGFTKFRGKEVALVVVYRLSKFCQFIGL